jgi:Rod binding domain-containing protein
MQTQQVNSSPKVNSSTKQDSQGANAKDVKLKAACQQFAAVLWNQVMDGMQETVPEDGVFGDDFSNDMFTSMLNQQYSSVLAGQDSSSNGLSGILYQQLSGITDVKGKASKSVAPHTS